MRPFSTVLPIAVSLVLLAGSVLAAPPPPPPPHHNGLRAAPPPPPPDRHRRPDKRVIIPAGDMTLDEAVRKVQRRTEGRILDARTVERDGRTFHRIKLLTKDNRVRVIRFDASGGQSEEE